jgi:hypothetical protein
VPASLEVLMVDYTLPFALEIGPPLGDASSSQVGPVSGYRVSASAESGTLIVDLEQCYLIGPGAGIAKIMGGVSTAAGPWTEWAAELIVDVVEQVQHLPTLAAGFSLVLGRRTLSSGRLNCSRRCSSGRTRGYGPRRSPTCDSSCRRDPSPRRVFPLPLVATLVPDLLRAARLERREDVGAADSAWRFDLQTWPDLFVAPQ